MADKAVLIVACLQERGFDAEVANDIGVHLKHGAQEEAAMRASDECRAEIDARYPDPPRLSDEETYQAYLDSIECLRELGIEISDPPTFEAWVDSGHLWTPHAEIPDWADFWAIHRRCPQPGLGLTPAGSGVP